MCGGWWRLIVKKGAAAVSILRRKRLRRNSSRKKEEWKGLEPAGAATELRRNEKFEEGINYSTQEKDGDGRGESGEHARTGLQSARC